MEKETATSTRVKLPWNTRTHEPSSRGVTSFFDLMFSRKVWDLIRKQTNLYAKQQIQRNPDPTWEEVTIGELKAWIGCLIAMGMDKKPTLQMYWDSTWKLPIVADYKRSLLTNQKVLASR